jgi:hypothetical protein
VNNLNEKILFQRGRTSDRQKLPSNPYNLKSATELNKADKKGVLVIDPNKVVDQYGQIIDRYVKQENLTIYASLKVVKKAETSVVAHSGGGFDANGNLIPPTVSADVTSQAIYVNFLNPLKNKKRADGTYERKGKFTTEWTDFFTSDAANDKSKGSYILDPETFGLHDIAISVNANHLPVIRITFTDIQGRMLFERGNDPDSPYNIFFTYPYPKFYLTYKGYFGKAVEIPMYLLKSNTRFIPETGDYEITAEFQSEMFGLFNTFLVIYAYVAPYMFTSDDGQFLGRKILNTLYEKQNTEILDFLTKNGTPELFNSYKIERSPTLYDLSRAVEMIPSSAFNTGDDVEGRQDEQILKIKAAIESYQKSIGLYFNNISNYTTTPTGTTTTTTTTTTINEPRPLSGILIYTPAKDENKLVDNPGTPIEIYNAIDSINKLINDVATIDSSVSAKFNVPSVIDKLREFIKNDNFITNRVYKDSIHNGNIIRPELFKVDPNLKGTEKLSLDKFKYILSDFERVIVELLNQISTLQNVIENKYIDNEVAELSEHLGYEPNLNNVLRIISNNMQSFLILMEVMSKNALKQLQNDTKRRKIHETKTAHINNVGSKTKTFTAFPNYYKTTKTTLSNGAIADRKVLAYPGVDASNQDWFEVLFVEEIYKALKTIKDISDPKSINSIEKKFTSLLTIFGLGELDLDVYKKKTTASLLLSEAISKYMLYTNYSGLIYRGLDADTMRGVGTSIANFEIDVLNKTLFNPASLDDNSRLRLDAFDFVKNKDTFIDPTATGISNERSGNISVKYTNLGNLAINGIKVTTNGGAGNATIANDTYGTVSIYAKLKEFMDVEIDLYGKKYTETEIKNNESKRKNYIDKSIQNKPLYNNINSNDKLGNNISPLKYSVTNTGGKSNNLNVYPDIRTNTSYYSDITKSNNFDQVNSTIVGISDAAYDTNLFQGFFKNMNESLKNNVILNSDTTRDVYLGSSTVPGLTHNTKNDDISKDSTTPFNKVMKPSTNYYKLFKEL